MKTCRACGAEKPDSEFYLRSDDSGKTRATCKSCSRARNAKWLADNRERRRAYRRAAYRSNDNIKEVTRANAKAWAKNHPDRRHAHGRVSSEIRAGRMKKLPCCVCGRPDSHAHHADYTKPLEVMWLCPVHHTEQHQKEGRIPTEQTW